MNEDLLIEIPAIEDKSHGIIKVIGVGGGGGNAVRNMYNKHCEGVSFAVCNTDSQALSRTEIPVRVQLGTEGLGVGGDPVKGRAKAEESMKQIEGLLSDGTQMVFITAGMGGGTGTGAAPVIAQMARDRGILTVGVVTIPFAFEKRKRIEKALAGVLQLEKHVDALLVINNERLIDIYSDGDTTCIEAFEHADDILSVSTRSIAEVITIEGNINRDFCDVKSVMQNGGSAIISVGYGEGDHRIFRAVEEALDSPLLTGIDIEHAQKMLCIVYSGKKQPVKTREMSEIMDFMETLSPDLEVFFGLYPDNSLEDCVKVSIIATGFNTETWKSEDMDADERIRVMKEHYYSKTPKQKSAPPEATEQNAEGVESQGIGSDETSVAADGGALPCGEPNEGDPSDSAAEGQAPQHEGQTPHHEGEAPHHERQEPQQTPQAKQPKGQASAPAEAGAKWGERLKRFLASIVEE